MVILTVPCGQQTDNQETAICLLALSPSKLILIIEGTEGRGLIRLDVPWAVLVRAGVLLGMSYTVLISC